MITFVTFRTQLSRPVRHQLGRITGALRVKDAAADGMRLLFTSARHFHPEAHLVLLSDLATAAPPVPGIERLRAPVARTDDPLWSRLWAEREFLRTGADPASDVALLDYDVLVNAPLSAAFVLRPVLISP